MQKVHAVSTQQQVWYQRLLTACSGARHEFVHTKINLMCGEGFPILVLLSRLITFEYRGTQSEHLKYSSKRSTQE